MLWRPLARRRSRSLPKLDNLRRAARAGLRVPETLWAPAEELAGDDVPLPYGIPAPWIVRSASPSEDNDEATAAGRFETRNVEANDHTAFRTAVDAVVASLPHDARGRREGAVFVQPLLHPERGGVAFFDGFYYERTTAEGGNQELTAGHARGDVERGTLLRDDPWSDGLRRLARGFRRELELGAALDIEFALDAGELTVLQVRPARFGVRRNPTLSLANHREILGDPPSPWIVAALEEAGGEALSFFAAVDPEVGRWNERYAIALGGRAWLNFSFFYRLMDHWGLPRAFVTEGIGGGEASPADRRLDFKRMLRSSWRLLKLQWSNLRTIARAPDALDELDRRIAAASDLRGAFDATVYGLGVALRTNFAINGALTGVARVRSLLGIRGGKAQVATEALMRGYDDLRALPAAQREAALERWLERHGHRGPLESDLANPRFRELREVLLRDLQQTPRTTPGKKSQRSSSFVPGFLFALDRRRESFRDELMQRWERLRARLLAVAAEAVAQGRLERIDHVYLMTPRDLETQALAAGVADERREEQARWARLSLPGTATREELEACLAAGTAPGSEARVSFRGIALGPQVFTGTVRKADDLVALLRSDHELDADTVLVVPALEPSWGVVFGRVGALVTELGGELSHASILLREAGKPAIVDCRGVFDGLQDGDRVRLDGVRGTVELVREEPCEEREEVLQP